MSVSLDYWTTLGRWATTLLFNEKVVVPRNSNLSPRLLKADLAEWLSANVGANPGDITIHQVRDPDAFIFVIKFTK